MLTRVVLSRLGRRVFPGDRRFDLGHSSSQHEHCYSSEANVVQSSYPCVDIPDITLNDFVWENVDLWPELTAIVCGATGRNYTYRQLREKCRRFSVSLRHMGLQPGARLGMVISNTPDYPVAVLGGLEAGLVITLINNNYFPGEMSTMLLETHPSALVCSPLNYCSLVEAIHLAEVDGYKPPHIIVAPSDCSCAVPHGAFSLEQLTGPSIGNITMSRVQVDPSTVAVIPFSSGTSCRAKGVALSHRNLVANNVQIHKTPEIMYQKPTSETFQDVVAAVLPFSHIYGFQNTLVGQLRLGTKVVTLSRFNGRAFLNMLKQQRVTLLLVSPTLVSFMVAASDVIADSLRTCRMIVCAFAPICPQQATQLIKTTGHTIRFIQGYGLTEASPVLCLSPIFNKNLQSVGKLLPGTRAKVVDVRTGRNLGPNEHGELCFKGPQIMLGYYNPKVTEQMIDKSGWLHTGGVGYYDDRQCFFIVEG